MSQVVLVGLDIGGTKTELVCEDTHGHRLAERRIASAEWSASPVDSAADWIGQLVASVCPGGTRIAAVGVGAQGCDTNEHCRVLEAALEARGYAARVVNDGALLVPAAGETEGIGVIAGTGAIAVGRDAAGRYIFAGGWGWVLGDDAGAVGIVREATRSALSAHDRGEADDGLMAALLEAFGAADPNALTRTVNDEPTIENWGPRAPAVFAAADAGSARAVGVIDGAAGHLVELVEQLRGRGGTGDVVVEAGTVIVRQRRLRERFEARLHEACPELRTRLLDAPPVLGAVALARSRAGLDHGSRPTR